YITTFAQDAKDWGNLVYLRPAHEMNGNWYAWDGYTNGGQTDGPANYIAAWKHIHDIFTNVGATNVKFVWSPNHESIPNESWNEAVDYYPGDNYVDWIAFDGYNWGNGNWESFDQIFSVIYATFESYGKSMMIGEFASVEDGGDKAAWITDAFSKIESDYPKIKIFNWFNIQKYESQAGGIVDWKVNSSTGASNAFNSAMQDSYFLESTPTN
ncbi:MAG: glycosyl hydrolase, partial [Candidatus Margulisiibacteriota bacterium]